jgi:hypothetical protein
MQPAEKGTVSCDEGSADYPHDKQCVQEQNSHRKSNIEIRGYEDKRTSLEMQPAFANLGE